MWACSGGHLGIVTFLMENGADINLQNKVRVFLFFFLPIV
jgi:ankyrin repeat protein